MDSKIRVALVHDYLNEYGGAERVLEAFAEIWPEAPIYTAFYQKDSPAYKRFADKKIVTSWAQKIPGFASRLHSPLRFLAPLIWESLDFDEYDVVVSSASWYITKGILTRPKTLHVCYCHTPPRYLYGYQTAMNWQKYWLVRQYARVVNKYLRQYDYLAAQRVDKFVTNSENTRKRIEKFYRRESEVIYPPVSLREVEVLEGVVEQEPYYLTGGRLVGAKNFELVIKAVNKLRLKLKVFGEGTLRERLEEMAGGTVEFVGRVDEEKLARLYKGAKAFISLAEDEDFGITPVESMMAGTPVIAFKGGGYVESVLQGKTGILIDEVRVESLVRVLEGFEDKEFEFDKRVIVNHAKKFEKEKFMEKMKSFVEREYLKLTNYSN